MTFDEAIAEIRALVPNDAKPENDTLQQRWFRIAVEHVLSILSDVAPRLDARIPNTSTPFQLERVTAALEARAAKGPTLPPWRYLAIAAVEAMEAPKE